MEIKKLIGCSSSTVFRYIQNVEVLKDYKQILRIKQGGSRQRAKQQWEDNRNYVNGYIKEFSHRDLLIFLAGLYWGEGSKSDFNLINGDPFLIRAFIRGLYSLGIKKDQIKFNLRMFSDMDKKKVIKFWTDFLEISDQQIGKCEIIKGNGRKKLLYGMCRVRVARLRNYFKLIMCMINFIKDNTKLS